MKKKGDACRKFKGQILPVFRFSSRKSSVAFHSLGEREYILPIFGFKGFVKVYFMVIKTGRGNMVHCFFQEHLGIGGIFRRKRGFWFGLLHCSSQCGHSGKAGYYWGIVGKEAEAASDDLVNGMIVEGMVYIL